MELNVARPLAAPHDTTVCHKSWPRGTPKERACLYDVVFAYALAHLYPNGGVVLVDLRRVGLSYFSGGAPIWRDVHRSLDLYLRYDIANVLTSCNVNVCNESVNHRSHD
jgi:hypothetical protein